MPSKAPSPLRALDVGDTIHLEAPTRADVNRIHRNVSQFGLRNDRRFRGKINRQTRIITFTRIA
jgi:hypothetical protein